MLVPHRFERARISRWHECSRAFSAASTGPMRIGGGATWRCLSQAIPDDHLLWIGGFGPPVDRPKVQTTGPPEPDLATDSAPS